MTFNAYIDGLGLSAEDADHLRASFQTWDDLHAWLEENQHSAIQPKPERISVATPSLNISWKDNIWRRFRRSHEPSRSIRQPAGWEKIVEYRRKVTLALTLVTTVAILLLSDYSLRAQQMPEITIKIYLAIYGVMTWFLAANFFKLILGTWHTLRGPRNNPWHPSKTAREPRPETKVAIIFPVYHEDVARVAAGMAATWESIETGFSEYCHHFDTFLLSDSRKLEYNIAEQSAVHRLREQFPKGRFFFRRRPVNLNAKLGNVTDFCRRWGRKYEYMLVMDADSIMDGHTIVELLRMMEGNERLGILQTNPKPVLRRSLFGRMQQFAARLYGAVFSYSLQAMFMGNASYIGHNAMIRMQPFIKHCILPELPGKAPWGGKPLSHDIVESAMMARAGYEVWFLPELEGSYEEIPANLLGFLIRERRWMQGNMQHLRFLFLDGLRSVHRETFLNGSMGYLAAPLWAMFLIVSAYGMVHFLSKGALFIGSIRILEMPMAMLLVSSLVFLFMPRILAFAVHVSGDRAREFGGKDKLALSLLLETIFSFFFSPIMMIYVTRFVWLWLKRRGISWGTQQRDDEPLPWSECFRHFGWISVAGVACWALLVYAVHGISTGRALVIEALSNKWVSPDDILYWFFPILAGFTGSVLIARLTSLSVGLDWSLRLFCIPEEICVPQVIDCTMQWETKLRRTLPNVENPEAVIDYAVKDIGFYVKHRPETRVRPHIASRLLPMINSGMQLSGRNMLLALSERTCFDALHIRAVHGDALARKSNPQEVMS
ncbi:glycosyl transferase 2 family protein [Pandoraea thiooxydans]|uniref:Glucans biosynthesis glucosyltransferase H n=1 Tax=Pandoraea thiooxydans TaxID=445709 RepID=A0A0G3ENR9_9BURK|nr:glucans biosynthesis glucosyltransferase MdoH [Pandoraea thiooxydans]AKJ66937.1 glucan biosynthesis glucosyltransferase H [Pandoraea thiooxydans]APR93830.1 glycosyl transferase 2 family protein [Pandoraea thiooxydans]